MYSISKRHISVILLVLALSWLSSCSDDEDVSVPIMIDKVLLVYLAGDNSLSGESYEKQKAIQRGWDGNPNTRILVYHDASDAPAKLIEIVKDNKTRIINKYSEENSADPLVFQRVIVEAKALYPQAVFNLLVFSHASGWLPQGGLTAPKSMPTTKTVLEDKGNTMTLIDFAEAIPDHAFDCIVFEACFMTGIEVVYQLRNKAHYIIGSSAEIISPGFTYLYPYHINKFFYNIQEFMTKSFDYFNNQIGWMRSATFSIIETDKLEALAKYVKANCDFTRPIAMEKIQYFDRNNYRLFADFENYHTLLLEKEEQRSELIALVDSCVIWKATTPNFMQGYSGFKIAAHSGMTAFIMQEKYSELNAEYRSLDWYTHSRTE